MPYVPPLEIPPSREPLFAFNIEGYQSSTECFTTPTRGSMPGTSSTLADADQLLDRGLLSRPPNNNNNNNNNQAQAPAASSSSLPPPPLPPPPLPEQLQQQQPQPEGQAQATEIPAWRLQRRQQRQQDKQQQQQQEQEQLQGMNSCASPSFPSSTIEHWTPQSINRVSHNNNNNNNNNNNGLDAHLEQTASTADEENATQPDDNDLPGQQALLAGDVAYQESWERFLSAEGRLWYWCGLTEEMFFADSAEIWECYFDPEQNRRYWHNREAHHWFWDPLP